MVGTELSECRGLAELLATVRSEANADWGNGGAALPR